MIINEKSSGLTEIAVSDPAKALHRKGTDEYTLNGRATIPTADLDLWEETDAPAYSPGDYKAKVIELLRERYDADDEAALIANVMEAEASEEHRAEFMAYQTYRNECKARAVEILTAKPEEEDNESERED